jgi:thiamine biosynthesis protein ThiS
LLASGEVEAVTIDYNDGRERVSNASVFFSDTKTIEVVVNGEPRAVPAGLNVETLLAFLEIDPSRVAVELNREIVHKRHWPRTHVPSGAAIEIVWFVGGG